MKEQELNNLLDKAIGTKGNLQIHSYWMNKTLKGIIEYNKTLINDNIELINNNIPTKISYLDNDIGYVTEDYVLEHQLDVDKTLNITSNNPISNSAIASKIYSISDSLNHLLSVSDFKYEFVDLGLPSGLLWATTNIGATKPEDPGLYFAWGETEGYSGITDTKKFTWNDYKLCNGSKDTITKYNYSDNLTVLEPVDDAAYVSDNTCRMPTVEEFQELADNTTITKERINNILVYRFTSNKNHNYIIIPFGGRLEEATDKTNWETMQLWTSSVIYSGQAYQFCAGSDSSFNSVNILRYLGANIRAVQEANTSSKFNPKETVSKLSDLESKTVEIENNKADKSELPTKVSDLENDSEFITGETLNQFQNTIMGGPIQAINNNLANNYYTKTEIDNMIISTLNTEV